MAQFIAKFMNDGRLVRVLGPQGAQYTQLILDPQSTEYDLVVDESPTAPDTKARTWAALIDILPAAMKMGIPVPPEILDYSPLPASLAEKWKALLGQGKAQIPPEVQAQMQKMAEEMTKLHEENVKLKVSADAKLKQLESDREFKLKELELEGKGKVAELKLRQEIAAIEADIDREKMLGELALERDRMLAEFGLKAELQDGSLGVEAEGMDRKHELARKDMEATHDIERTRADETTKLERQKAEKAGEGPKAMGDYMKSLQALTDKIDELQKPKSRQILLKYTGGKVSGADIVEEGGKRGSLTVNREGGKIKGATTTKGKDNG